MKDASLEIAVGLLGLLSGGMAVALTGMVASADPPALYNAAAAARTETMEAGVLFFLGGAVLSAGILYLRRPRKRQTQG